jgi:chromosome segregation ATPase
MVYMIMQKSTMEKVYADECRKLKSQIAELEQKLEDATQSLNVAESNLAVRNAEVDSLQNSLKDLDELREFKAVRGVQ